MSLGWFIALEKESTEIKKLQSQYTTHNTRVILVDHYDSFTYTIKSYLEVLGAEVCVLYYDDPKLTQLECLSPTHIVLSPGPGAPSDVWQTKALIKKIYKQYPILGVCLGHQCLIETFNGQVIPMDTVYHGKVSTIFHTGQGIFKGLKQQLNVARYHSLIVSKAHIPIDWELSAWSLDGNEQVVMGVQHTEYPLFGVQYHPEAILTEAGYQIFSNFINYTNRHKSIDSKK